MDHDTLLQNLWVVVGISLGGGAFASQIAGVAGGLGFGAKLLVTLGIAGVIFGTIWFFAPTHT
jgi:hypothetical protein